MISRTQTSFLKIQVWIGIVCVIPCVLLAFCCSQRCFKSLKIQKHRKVEANRHPTSRKMLTSTEQPSFGFSAFIFYVFEVLLNQGKGDVF